MTHAEKHIVDTYSELFESLSSVGKLELLERLVKSIRKDKKSLEKEFFKSFGAFASEKPAEEIAREIKESRRFREKGIKL
jgi:tRNA A-37 threonylcarbamoyl transferase component Bud32